jgi:4-hydroxybenzoate polyprenyltransferase
MIVDIATTIKEYARLIRLKAMGVSTIAVVGALSSKGALDIQDFFVLFFMGILFNILGFVLNDYIDYHIDKQSEDLSNRPLVKGIISRRTALIISILCCLLLFVIAFIFYNNFLPIFFLTIAIVLGIIYDIFGKKFIGSDIFLSASIAFFYLFGVVTISDNIEIYHVLISAIYFTHVLYFNIIEGGFKDADTDKSSGAKTTASHIGVKNRPIVYVPMKFKVLSLSIESTSVFFLLISFFIISSKHPFAFWYIQLVILLILIISLYVTSTKMLNLEKFDRKKVAITITKQEVKRYITIPVILIGFADIFWIIIVLFLPTIWYFTYTICFHEKPFKSKML